MNRFLFLVVALTATLFAAPVPLQDPVPATAAPPPSRWTEAELAHFHAVSTELAKARAAISAAEASMIALARTPARPPVIVDPPDPPDPPTDPAAWPDYSGAPFASLLPTFPSYRIPTLADCEWTISGGVATSTRGLPPIAADAEGAMLGAAYRASIAAGHVEPITFGVHDDAGPAYVGGIWNPDGARSITSRNSDGTFKPLRVEIVGLDDQCEVGASGWGGPWGWTEFVGFYNIGIRGAPDSFNIRANNPCGTVILDGCWFLPSSPSATVDAYVHCANWHTLVVRRTKARGESPADPPQLCRQHNFYFKNTGPGGLFIVENEFQGSNGTCFQVRPGAEETHLSVPAGPVVISHNRSNGYGWEWGNTPATAHGGSALTVWSSPYFPVFVYRNTITDARYGCLVFSQQPAAPSPPYADRNWYNEQGFPIGAVYIAENVFGNPRSARQPVSITAAQSVHIWDTNRLENGTWTLNSEWAATHGFRDIKNGTVRLYGGPMQGENYWTFDGTQTRAMTPAEVSAMRVATPVPLGG